MANEIDVSFVPAFQDLIVGLFQTDPDNIQATVRSRTITGKSDHWERLGGVDLVQVTTRHQATPHTPMAHSRRRALLSDYAGSEMLDQLDQVKAMIDPRNEYTQNLLRAWRRRKARTIITALNASALSLDASEAATGVALPASQSIANGGTGLTMAKLRTANRILDNSGVPRDGNRTLLTSAYGIEDLLADTQVTSSDFSTLNAIMTGTIAQGATFMGMKVITISDAIPDDTATLTGGTGNPLLPKTGNIRSCFLYHHDAVGLSIAKEATAEVDRLPTNLNAWQVLVQCSLGAVRILDGGVIQIDIDETA
jgi:capsid protein